MSKTNIEYFDEVTVKIFAELYQSFPLPVSINCLELTGKPEMTEMGELSKEAEICVAGLKWLAAEGYLTVKHSAQSGAGSVILTAKGLASLKAAPDSLESKISVGERLVAAVKLGAVSTGIEVLKLVF